MELGEDRFLAGVSIGRAIRRGGGIVDPARFL